ncbi:MAG: hypothetical protein AAB363_11080, partial [Planctomycetota bacterium]
ASLVDQNMDRLSVFVGSAQDPQGGAVVHGGKRARIAVVDQSVTILNQSRPVAAHSPIDVAVLGCDALSLSDKQAAQRSRVRIRVSLG